MKVCSKCKIEKNISDFTFRNDTNKYRNQCKECVKLSKRNYYKRTKKQKLKYQAEYAKNHKKEKKEYDEKYYELNKKEIKKRVSLYAKNRKKVDIQYRLTCILRSRLYKLVKGINKTGSAVRDLGCSVDFLKQHLESNFYSHPKTGEQMSWDNYRTTWLAY